MYKLVAKGLPFKVTEIFNGRPPPRTVPSTHTYDPGAEALAPSNSNRDIKRKLAPDISSLAHTDDLGARDLPLTNGTWRH